MNRLVVLIPVALAALLLAAPGERTVDAAQPGEAIQAANQATQTREAVIDRVKRLTAILQRTDRIEAKLTTLSAYEAARGLQLQAILKAPATKEIWVVAAAGEVRPAFAKALPFTNQVPRYQSAAFVVDPETGSVLSTHASDSAWPTFFERIVDLAR